MIAMSDAEVLQLIVYTMNTLGYHGTSVLHSEIPDNEGSMHIFNVLGNKDKDVKAMRFPVYAARMLDYDIAFGVSFSFDFMKKDDIMQVVTDSVRIFHENHCIE